MRARTSKTRLRTDTGEVQSLAQFSEFQRDQEAHAQTIGKSPTARSLLLGRGRRHIIATIKDRADKTNEMTIAARNRTIEDENDLDVFLEACLRLGMTDSEGNLKD